MVTAQILQEHPSKKKRLQLGPCKLLPVFLTAGSRSTLLEADHLSGEEQVFVAVLCCTLTSTCSVYAERPGWKRWPSAISSSDIKESDASRIRFPKSPDGDEPRRGAEPPKEVGSKTQPGSSSSWYTYLPDLRAAATETRKGEANLQRSSPERPTPTKTKEAPKYPPESEAQIQGAHTTPARHWLCTTHQRDEEDADGSYSTTAAPPPSCEHCENSNYLY